MKNKKQKTINNIKNSSEVDIFITRKCINLTVCQLRTSNFTIYLNLSF